MAFAVTNRASAGDTSNTTSYTSSSFTPAANSLLIVCVSGAEATNTPAAPSISNTGTALTWVQISGADLAFQGTGANRARMTIFAALVGASPGATTVTVVYGAALTGLRWSIFDVTGSDVAASGVAGTFVQVVATSANLTGTSLAITVAAAGSSNNRAFLFVDHNTNESITPEAGGFWNQIGQALHNSPTYQASSQWNSTAFDTSVTASWPTSSNYGGIAFELKALVVAGAYTLAPATASYPYAGNNVFLRQNFDTASYPYAGNNVNLVHGYPLAVVTASYPYSINPGFAKIGFPVTTAGYAYASVGITFDRTYRLKLILNANSNFPYVYSGAYPRYKIKKAPVGIFHLLSAQLGIWWVGLGSETSLLMPYVDGYRGRGQWNDPLPDSIADTPNWANIDAALVIIAAYNKKLGLNMALGVQCPMWMFDEAPTTPRFLVDVADDFNTIDFFDGVINGTTTLVSQHAGFFTSNGTDGDVGISIQAPPGQTNRFQNGTTIASIVSPTTCILNKTTQGGSHTGVAFRMVARPFTQPIPWDPVYLAKVKTLVALFAAKYDGHPNVAYILANGFMQNTEMYLSNTVLDDSKWDALATSYGFADKDVAFTYAFKTIMGYYRQSFLRTPVLNTSQRIYHGADGPTLRTQLDNWMIASCRNHELGLMIAYLHATLPPHTMGRVPYASGSQAVSISLDDSRFYNPPLPNATGSDGVANGTATYTSASGHFSTDTPGKAFTGDNIPPGTTVVTRNSATSVVLSNLIPAGINLNYFVQVQPVLPQPVDDLTQESGVEGRTYCEVYDPDIADVGNASVLAANREKLRDLVIGQSAFTTKNYPFVGNDVLLEVPKRLTVDHLAILEYLEAFVFLYYNRRSAPASASYPYTANNVAMPWTHRLNVHGPANYSYNANSVGPYNGRTLAATKASYGYGVSAVKLLYGHKVSLSPAGSFPVTFNPLYAAYGSIIAPATFVYTASSVALRVARQLGTQATVNYPYAVGAASFGVKLLFGGRNYSFIFFGPMLPGFKIGLPVDTQDAGHLTVADAGLTAQRKLAVASANFPFACGAVASPRTRVVSPASCNVTFTVHGITLLDNHRLGWDTASFAYSATSNVDISKKRIAIVTHGSFSYAGSTITFDSALPFEVADAIPLICNSVGLDYQPFPRIPQPELPQPAVPGGQIYVTVQDDMWDLISLRVYGMKRGSDHYGDKLLEANPALNVYPSLPGGLLLSVPELPVPTEVPLVPWKKTTILTTP